MKELVILCLFISVLLACNNLTETSSGTEVQKQEQVKPIVDEGNHANTIEGLTLNNGVKWNGDEPTNANVKNLESILDNFKPSSSPATNDYINLANNFQTGLDKMITECRMKGADHDALHLWLEPLIGKVNNLKAIIDINAAEAITKNIKEHVHLYHAYFE